MVVSFVRASVDPGMLTIRKVQLRKSVKTLRTVFIVSEEKTASRSGILTMGNG